MSRSSAALKPSSADSRNPIATWFERRVVPHVRRFANLPYLLAVRDALPLSFSALIVAIVALFPATPGHAFAERLAHAYLPAFGVMAAAFTVALSVAYARRAEISRTAMLLASIAGFVLGLPRPFAPDAVTYLRAVGPTGLFLAMLVVGVVAGAVAIARRTTRTAFGIWLGACLAIACFACAAYARIEPTMLIAHAMSPLATLGDTFGALLAIVLIETLLWIVGIHGPALLAAIVTPIYLTLQAQNTDAYAHHQPLPHIVVVSLFLFIFPGGAGATFPLAVLFARSRVRRLQRLGRVTLLPAFFNLNEPLLFGAPVVFNPYLALPFLIVPLALATTTYFSVAFAWVARPAVYLPSSIPSVISAYLSTLDVRAVLLVLVNVTIATIVYVPFVRAYERHLIAHPE